MALDKSKMPKRKLNEMKSGSSGSSEEGNTIPPRPTKKRCNPAKKWVFTDFDTSGSRIQAWRDHAKIDNLAFQEETCPETKRDHLQGCFTLKKKGRPITELGFEGVHYELQRGTDVEAANYANKDETRKEEGVRYRRGYAKAVVLMTTEMLRHSQLTIADKFREDEDPLFGRKIHWFWEAKGGWGKSILAKYMVDQMGAIVIGGASKDCLHVIAEVVTKTGDCPRMVIFDVPRTNNGHVSYQAIEAVKNGMFCSGKYESKMVRFNSPHVLVFANQEPEREKLSADRWIINELKTDLFD